MMVMSPMATPIASTPAPRRAIPWIVPRTIIAGIKLPSPSRIPKTGRRSEMNKSTKAITIEPRIVPTCIPRRAPTVADIDIKIHVRATVRIIRIIAVTIISVTQIQIDLIRSGDRNLTRRMITNDTFRIFSIRTTLGRRLILIAILIDNGIILTIRLLHLD